LKSGPQTRLLAVLLAVFTVAAMGLSIANLIQESSYDPATDGARWTETRLPDGTAGLRAYLVPEGTPAERAGVRVGDVLTAIDDVATPNIAAAEREIARSGVWSNATYSLLRQTPNVASGKSGGPNGPVSSATRAIPAAVYLQPADRTDYQVMRLIALVYLAIGLYVLFRRWTAPKSTHFYVFCLVSFILYSFKYTGVLDGLDLTILVANVLATALQPALFLQFAFSFTERSARRKIRRFYPLLYLPGAVLVALRYLSLAQWSPTERLQHRLDQIDYAYLAVYYIAAAVLFWARYQAESQPLERQQLKWLSRGTVLTVVPFTALYVVPFLVNLNVPSALTRLAVLSLILLPLTFSWAIVRYRLMDVDLIFKRGMTYTLATAALVGLYFGTIALTALLVHQRLQQRREWALVATVIVAGLVFDPLKRMIQGQVDRLFDQKSIDYRETLVEFGRELNAQTDLRALVNSIVERLPETLLVTRVAVFLAKEERGQEESAGRQSRYSLAASHGLSQQVMATADTLELGFLDFDQRNSSGHLFFETPQAVLRLPERERQTAAALDLNYYVPCRAARHEGSGRSAIAVLGLGRTGAGDFLSSEDMELLESLAGYIGIAIQNAQLYRRLEQKIFDFERLRDFNENIVESINIGVFAVDLEDRVESWNAQMEVMYATPRAEALRRPLREVFPAEFLQEFDRLRGEQGVCTLYKFRLATPTGEARTANITVAPLLNRDFRTVGRIVIVDDITERINMETQLAQAEKLSSIGLLAAGVAHEVNTPLAVISSYTQMLGKQLQGDDGAGARLRPVLDKITQQTFRASEIVNGLLNFSRMGSVEFSRIDMNAMVNDTVLLLEHQMRSAGVTVRTSLSPGLPQVLGNRGKLQQVLVNLVLNARDALQDDAMRGQARGGVRITTAATSNGVEMRVEDDGPGMSADVLRKIYDPFFTTKSNPKDGQRKGTGLGLAVTYGIVQEHAGTIEVVSNVGEGTVFRLELPAADAAAVRAKANEEGPVVHV
jgi:PAS domain S-box-containing protein